MIAANNQRMLEGETLFMAVLLGGGESECRNRSVREPTGKMVGRSILPGRATVKGNLRAVCAERHDARGHPTRRAAGAGRASV